MTSLNTQNSARSSQKFTSQKIGEIFFWFLWPFGALVRGIRQYKTPTGKLIVWLFCIYFGSVLVIPEDKPGAADSARYARSLIAFHEHPLSFSDLWSSIYTTTTYYVDVYQPVATWLIASFTSDPRWLFMLFSAVFGFFYVNNLWIILEQVQNRIRWHHFFFLLSLALVIPIWYVNGVRMYTASQMFLYGFLLYYLKEDKRGLIWAAMSIFVHFSFFFPVAALLLYILVPKSVIVFFVFYIATSIYHEININQVRSTLSGLPAVFQPRVEGYTSEERAEQVKESEKQKRWHVRFANATNRYLLYLWTIIIFVKGRVWIYNQYKRKMLFAFALFFGGLANLASSIPSGQRFLIISDFLFYSVICLILIGAGKNLMANRLAKIAMPFLLFVIVFRIRAGFDFLGILTFFGNLPLAFMFDTQTPLIEFVKALF